MKHFIPNFNGNGNGNGNDDDDDDDDDDSSSYCKDDSITYAIPLAFGYNPYSYYQHLEEYSPIEPLDLLSLPRLY